MTTDDNGSDEPKVTRRSFARATTAAGITVGVAGCSSGGGGGDGGGSGDGGDGGSGDGGDGSGDGGGGSGDGGGSSGTDEVTLVFNTSVSGEQWDAYLNALREAGLPERIQFELGNLPEQNREQQWERWLGAGLKEPDLFMIKSTVGPPFMHRGLLQNLDSLVSDETKQILDEDVPDTLVDFFKRDGSLYAVPFLFDFSLIQYRKDLVEEAGFNPSDWATNPLSWEKFSSVMSQTAEQSDVDDGFGFSAQGRSVDQFFFEKLKSYGGAIWGENAPAENIGEREITLAQEEGLTAMQSLIGLIYGDEYEHSLGSITQCSPQAVLQWLDTPIVQNMSGGNLAGIRNFSWSIPTLGSEENFGEDLGVMPLPYGVPDGEGRYPPGGGSRSVAAAWHIAINPNSEHKEEAAMVLDAIVSENAELTLFEVQGYAPPRASLYQHERIQNMDIIGRYSDALNYAVNHVGGAPSLNPIWAGEKERIINQVSSALRREKPPQEALSTAATQIEEYEAENADF